MAKLTKVQLPLALANNSGIARDAFKGCTNQELKTIEFDFTTASATNGLDNLGEGAPTQLANIYKMFAASDSEFTYNGIGTDTTNSTPTKNQVWLPLGGGTSGITQTTVYNKKDNNNLTNNFTSTINGITWKAEIPSVTTSVNTSEHFVGKLEEEATTQVTITGTVANGVGLKYKYTNTGDGHLDNNSQSLPSNITMIKIVLNKKSSTGR